MGWGNCGGTFADIRIAAGCVQWWAATALACISLYVSSQQVSRALLTGGVLFLRHCTTPSSVGTGDIIDHRSRCLLLRRGHFQRDWRQQSTGHCGAGTAQQHERRDAC